MDTENAFHSLFLLYSLVMISCRGYYCGYAAASGEGVSRLQEGLALRRIRYTLGGAFLLGALLYLLNPQWMTWSQWSDFPSFLRGLGILILLGSAFLYIWTHRHLDKNFTDTVFVRKKATLVKTGPYFFMRHPMYTSAMMVAVGTCLTTANWLLGALGVTLMLVIMIWRTPIEEEKLIERHGKDYRNYRARTGRFFPKLGHYFHSSGK